MTTLLLASCSSEEIPAAPTSTSRETADASEQAVSLPPPNRDTSNSLPLEITVTDAKPLLGDEDVVWIDCREQAEWDAGHIAGVQLFPMSTIADRLAELNDVKDERIIVYCRMGGRSLNVTKLLRENGFTNTQSMAGGITKWAEEVDPTLKP